ncbi:MAG: hypothetical protein ISR48_00410 [Alphaproteobacteria bacterium]|nr:hypothetical protein [Alphaproteobacteria bacterium]
MVRLGNIDDIPAISKLHYQELKWTINGRLGLIHIQKIYENLWKEDDFFVVVYENPEDGNLAGFISATTNSTAARERIRRVVDFRKSIRIVGSAFLHPGDIPHLLENVFLIPRDIKKLNISAEILSWVVDTDTSIGSQAGFFSFFKCLKEIDRRGFSSCFAQVLKSNQKPNLFYRKIGRQIARNDISNCLYVIPCASTKTTG